MIVRLAELTGPADCKEKLRQPPRPKLSILSNKAIYTQLSILASKHDSYTHLSIYYIYIYMVYVS